MYTTEYKSKRNLKVKPRWFPQQTQHQAPTLSSIDKSLGRNHQSEVQPAGVQLKSKAKLSTVIGLTTKQAVCRNTLFVITNLTNLVALLLLSCRCIVTINDLWIFLTVPWVGLQCVIVVFLTDHTHLLFIMIFKPICMQK